MFGIVNEPLSSGQIGLPALASWSFEAYQVVKSVCGTGEGHGPYVSMHHGFESASAWVGLYPNADRVALDLHPYLAFNTTPYNGLPGERVTLPCANWGNMVNGSQRDFGVTTAGEWSLAINDCGQWLNGIDLGTRIEGTFRGSTRIGSCDLWSDWPNWNQTVKTGFLDLALTSMDSLQNSFFWTWKIGNSSRTGKVEMPFWSYSLGLQHGCVLFSYYLTSSDRL
jgi:glucan 1,3-beta-glucosidase